VSLSIIELIVYGLFAYSSMLVLIISINKEQPADKIPAIIRSIYLIPGIICAGVIATSGAIDIDTITTFNTITNLNSSEVWTEQTAQEIILQHDVWIAVHVMIMAVMTVYVIQQLSALIIKY